MNLIFQNAAATYARSLVALLLGLFSSRWILQALGASDFGISVAVGSLMAFATFVGDLLRISTARYFAYAKGVNGGGDLPRWFHSAFFIHLVLAVVLVVLMLPLGEILIRNVLVFPAERLKSALALFRLSVLAVFVTTVSVPFGALFTACQRFVVPSIAGVIQTVWVFVCAAALGHIGGDRLVWYGAYMCVGIVLLQLVLVVAAIVIFQVRGDWVLGAADRVKIRQLLSFAGWSLFGSGGYLVAMHGSAFVTNRFFGTLGNAAYGVAQQVQYHTEALANALVGAFEPAVTTRSAAGEDESARRLAGRGGLLAALLLAVFAVPLMAEMDTVLELWLVTPPRHAGSACSILLAVSVVNKLTMGQQMALAANGRIARWQMVSGCAQMLALPATAVYALACGSVLSAAYAYATCFLGCLFANLHYGQKIAGMRVGAWLRDQVLPFLAILFVAVVAAGVPRLALPAGIGRLLATTGMTSLIFAVSFCILFLRWRRFKR